MLFNQRSVRGLQLVADLPVGQTLMDQPNVSVQVAIEDYRAIRPAVGGKVWGQPAIPRRTEPA